MSKQTLALLHFKQKNRKKKVLIYFESSAPKQILQLSSDDDDEKFSFEFIFSAADDEKDDIAIQFDEKGFSFIVTRSLSLAGNFIRLHAHTHTFGVTRIYNLMRRVTSRNEDGC